MNIAPPEALFRAKLVRLREELMDTERSASGRKYTLEEREALRTYIHAGLGFEIGRFREWAGLGTTPAGRHQPLFAQTRQILLRFRHSLADVHIL